MIKRKLFHPPLISNNKFFLNYFFIIFFISFSALFFYILFPNEQNSENLNIENLSKFEDEIEPFCNEIKFEQNQENKFYHVKTIDINIENLREYYSNLISIIVSEDKIIQPKYKEVFSSIITFEFSNNTSCIFDAEIRLSGDWSDHIYAKKVIGSFDVKLLNGNVDGITKFKLFLPRTRNHENEIFVATLMEEIGFISPRTSFVNIKIDNYQGEKIVINDYIFQEKFSKELIEYYQYREGPLLEIDESFRWNKIIENNFTEYNRKYFLPAKVLNKYWGRKNIRSEEITIEGLEKLNQAIFNANQPWTQLNYKYLGDNTDVLYKFDAALIALDSVHAITNHQRKFYYNKIENQFYPIYYDGDSLFLWQSRKFETRLDYEDYKGLANGASEIIQNFDVDIDSFKKKLDNRGLVLDNNQIKIYFEIFIDNLISIRDSNLPNNQKDKNYLIDTNPINTLNLPNNDLNLIFYNSNTKIAEVCGIKLVNCIDLKLELTNYDIFSQNSILENFNGVLFGKSKDSYLSIKNDQDNSLEKIFIDNVELTNFGGNILEIDTKNKILNIEIVNKDGRVLLKGPGTLSNWKINLNSNLNIKQSEIRIDNNLLTGCLTVYNIKLNQTSFMASQKICEDSLNIIRSRGVINNISIKDSIADGLDVDFSNLSLDNITIENSGNDCIDLSSGNYKIKNINVKNCIDKGISIGEKSNVKIQNINVSNTGIGVAIKDSSVLEVNYLQGENNQMCVAVYRKKQEFGPSFVKIQKYNCISNEENYSQAGSEILYGNK